MDKKLIKEDIDNMKFLMGYKPGKVISEQDTKLNEGPKKHYGSFNDEEWYDQDDRQHTGDFDFDFDEEEFNDFPSFKEKHPDSKWFGDEKYFDTYKKQHDKPFKVRTRKGSDEEMFEGYEYDDVDELNPDDFNDDEQSRVNDLKQKHGIKFRGDFDGDDDEWMDYMSDNRDSFDNFSRENKRTNVSTDPIVFDPTDDETSQLKQRHGVKFRDEFDDDDVFMDYIQNNRDSFDNLSKDLNDLRQTKRNR